MGERESQADRPAAATRVPTLGRVAAVLVVCAIGILGPALAVDGRVGLPRFEGAPGAFGLVTFGAYAVLLVGFAVLGILCVRGRRVPGGLFLLLAPVPAAAGFHGWSTILAIPSQPASAEEIAARLPPELAERVALPSTPEIESMVLRVAADAAERVAAFGLVATGCAFLVAFGVVAVAHQAAMSRRGFDVDPSDVASSGRTVVAVVLAACVALVPVVLHQTMVDQAISNSWYWLDQPRETGAFAVAATGLLGSLIAAIVGRRIHLLDLEGDVAERGRLWRRAALLPVCAASAAICFEAAVFFGTGGWRGGEGCVVFEGALTLVAVGWPLLSRRRVAQTGLRTLGPAFGLSCAAVLASAVGLSVQTTRLRETRDELVRLRQESMGLRPPAREWFGPADIPQ